MMRRKNIIFSAEAWDDYLYWKRMDKRKVKTINHIIKSIIVSFNKEKTFLNAAKIYSISIDFRHRVIFKIDDYSLNIISCRLHE